jgi:hypothetical protein
VPEKEIIAVQTAEINSSSTVSGNITAPAIELTGSLEASNVDGGGVDAIASLNGSLGALVEDDSFNGALSALNIHDGAATGTVTLRIGQDGQDGKDGFSPTITVHKDTSTEYILKVTNKDGSYLTPNLYPDIEGLQDVENLVKGKVDKDLSTYPTVELAHFNKSQRENSYMYVNTYNNKAVKVSTGTIALVSEVEDRLRTKVRTVNKRPSTDWRLGDYIFLDIDQEDGE